MSSILPRYEYDIFISYRQKDNKGGHWVTDFVDALKTELEATFKEDISIYFDENPHDGLLEVHNVDKSLEGKLKCLIFIPIISQTYCDPKSFSWQHEFCAFNKLAREDQFGMDIRLSNGNVTSRILPIKIHELDAEDKRLLENEIGGALRPVEFIYHSAGVNRPLTPLDNPDKNLSKTLYRDQINKVANVVKEIILSLKNAQLLADGPGEEKQEATPNRIPFSAELSRRNVLRASVVYILVAILFWKSTSIGLSMLDLPAMALKIVALFLIIFFPIAILLAWLFERSPQGFIRSESTASLVNPFSPDQKKPFTSNVFILLLLATLVALFSFFPGGVNNIDENRTYVSGIDPSLAVIPFDNLSNDPDQDYISDGMMEAILSHLNKIEGLRLTSRTTMMTYKDTKKTIPEIADEVGVRFVLEGTVQRVDNTIRINAQLIDGLNDNHIWSEYYDRDVSNLLNIQSEVAQQIANKLEVKIKPEAKAIIENVPTKNTKAYDLYLKAAHLRLNDFDASEEYRMLIEEALALDPQFALLYAEMGWYWIWQNLVGSPLTTREVIQKAEPLLNKSIQMNPNERKPHIWLGHLNLWFKWDFNSAEREYNYAIQLEPSNPEPENHDLLVSLGKFNDAVKVARKQLMSEPNNVLFQMMMGVTLYFNGQHDESLLYLDSVWRKIEKQPSIANYQIYGDSGRGYLYLGKYERVVTVLEKAISKGILYPRIQGTLAIALNHLGKREKNKPNLR